MDNKRLLFFLNKSLLRIKNKLIFLYKAGCHRTKIIKEFVELNNKFLYMSPLQLSDLHYWKLFNILKSRLKQKNNNLSYTNLCLNL